MTSSGEKGEDFLGLLGGSLCLKDLPDFPPMVERNWKKVEILLYYSRGESRGNQIQYNKLKMLQISKVLA